MNKNNMRGIKMKEEYKKVWKYMVILIPVIFMLSVIIGFFSSRQTDEAYEAETVLYIPEDTVKPEKEQTFEEEKNVYYLIDKEDEELRLYMVEGEKSTKLRSEVIQTGIFPKDDMELLEQGIKMKTSEEALEVWENFIS